MKLDSIGCEWAGCDSTVGVEEHGGMEAWKHGELQVSPNPSGDWITLTFPENVYPGPAELAIYNLIGQEVINAKASPQNKMVSLNISNLSPGVYLVTCKDSGQKILKGQFVVAR